MRKMFSKNQIKRMVAESPQEVLEALQNQDLKVKTIEQSQANWECDIKSLLESSIIADSSSLYAKFVQYGNTIYFILSGKFINGTNTDQNAVLIDNKDIVIPDEIASKIFRADGSKLNENTSGTGKDLYICGDSFIRNTNNVGSGQALIQSSASKKITFIVYGLGTHAEGDKCFIDIRIPILIS